MSEMQLVAAVFTPFAAAGLLWLFPHRFAKVVALIACSVSFGLTLLLKPKAPGFSAISEWPTFAELGLVLKLGVDGISWPLLVAATLVGVTSVLFARPLARQKEFFFYLLLALGAALGAFASLNLFYFFFFCELATLPKYLLVNVFGQCQDSEPTRQREKRAALKLTLYIAGSGLLVLLGIALLNLHADTQFDFLGMQASLRNNPLSATQESALFGLLLVGFGVWTTLWPFHTWAPVAYEAAPPAATMLFAGVLKNLGAYGLLRVAITLLPNGALLWSPVIAVLAMINILYGAFLALRQTTWNNLVAYASISHAGYVLLGLATLNTLGVTASVLFMVVHGLFMALMFGVVGHLQTQSRIIGKVTGVAQALPLFGLIAVAAAMAGSGMAGFGNFVSEIMIFFAAFKSKGVLALASVVAVFGMVLTAIYMLRAVRSTFYGSRSPGELTPPAVSQHVAYALLLLALLATGFYPRILTDDIAASVSQLTLHRN